MEPRAQLGDTALRVVGLAVWLVVGGPEWLHAPSLVWLAMYGAFAVALLAATDARLDRRARSILLAAQSALAIALAVVGMKHFEGALLALVAAQVAMILPLRVALAWSAAQAVPLFFIVLPTHETSGAAKATGEYLAFAVFASLVGWLREREAVARRELARERATLVATQSLLADGARTHERVRLAREVHDAIGHGLAAASVNLEIAARTKDAAAIDSARAAVKETLAELRGLVGAMRTENAIDLGVALRVLCAGVREPRVVLEAPEKLRLRDPARAHVLFRAVQEGLTNAIKHARAKTIHVTVTRDETTATAIIRDDGVGAGSTSSGSGLEGLRERVADVGGEVDVETHEGRGFSLRVKVPV